MRVCILGPVVVWDDSGDEVQCRVVLGGVSPATFGPRCESPQRHDVV